MRLNLTPLRLGVLQFLADRRGYVGAKGLVANLCPRQMRTGAWSEQALARMTGKVLKPLREAGLVATEPFVNMSAMGVRITEAGRVRLAEHETAMARIELDRAIESGH